MTQVSYSDGRTVQCVIEVWEDLHTERAGYYRAFWVDAEADHAELNCGSPVVGYCSPGGSHRTIKAVVAECRRLGYSDLIFRNGRRIS